jgi:PTS system nitrogen regulatory IIA component
MTQNDTLAELLAPAQVVLRLRAATKTALLSELTKRAAQATGIPQATLGAALAGREALGSTGFGNGIAVPHARLDGLDRVFCMVAVLDKPVPFDAVDGKPVDIAFLLLSPTSANSAHLSILAAATRKLRQPDIAAAIRAAGSAEQVVQAFL